MGKRLLVIISNSSLDRKQQADQQRALVLLSAIGITPEKFPGDDPGQEEKRDKLFAISGLKGNYPQLFVIDDEDESATKFIGNYDDLQTLADDGELTREALELPAEDSVDPNDGGIFIGGKVEKQGEESKPLDMEKLEAQKQTSELAPKDPVNAADPGTVPAEVERLEGSGESTPGSAAMVAAVGASESKEEESGDEEEDELQEDKSVEEVVTDDEFEEEVVTDDEFEEEEVATDDESEEEEPTGENESRSTEVASRTAEGDNDWMGPPKEATSDDDDDDDQSKGSESAGSSWLGPSQASKQEPHDPFEASDDNSEPFVASKEDLFPEDPFESSAHFRSVEEDKPRDTSFPYDEDKPVVQSRAAPIIPMSEPESFDSDSETGGDIEEQRSEPESFDSDSETGGDIEEQRQEIIRRRKEQAEKTAKNDCTFHIMVACFVVLIAGGGAAAVAVFYEP
jgi:hypothetical protein